VPAAGAAAISWLGAAAFAASLGWFLYCYLVTWGVPAPEGPVARPVLVDVALFFFFALHHSLFARTGLKARLVRLVPVELERSLYTWISSALFVLACTLWVPVPGVVYRAEGLAAVAGYLVQAAGIALTLYAGRRMDFLDLAGVRQVQIAARGRQPAHVGLQTTGLYGFVRHPLYFSWVLMVFGSPAMTATRLTFALTSTAYLAIAIHWEERSLVGLFGGAYVQYRRHVRWRMIPFLY
jgi:protein-S-isoprenylcysteine O-methyltransferase Ste14